MGLAACSFLCRFGRGFHLFTFSLDHPTPQSFYCWLLWVQRNTTLTQVGPENSDTRYMNQVLAKYQARMARYTLATEDNTLIRFAGPQRTPWEEATEVKNISLTGLAFTSPSDICPQLGEVIKIEFSIPGGQQTACYALVTRLEAFEKTRLLVAVKFHRLNLAQKVILAQALTLKMREQQLLQIRDNQKVLIWVLAIPFAITVLAGIGLWLLRQTETL